jgi:NHS family nucleoside permease-like MFS transporter
MIVYGVAFDFFNIPGSLFVDSRTDKTVRSSAQGLFMLMTNGVGASLGMIAAQAVVNNAGSWQAAWYIFAAYALVVGVAFALLFKPEKK